MSLEENSGKDEDDAEREESPEARVATLTASLAQRERELEELRSELAAERHARKKETNDHAIMLRELQKQLSEERRSRKKLEAELFETAKRAKGAEATGVRNDEQGRQFNRIFTCGAKRNAGIVVVNFFFFS